MSAGLLGPTLRAQEGETLVVTFRNMATGAHSIHPHGVAYGKQSEGERPRPSCSPGGVSEGYTTCVNTTNNPVCLLLTY